MQRKNNGLLFRSRNQTLELDSIYSRTNVVDKPKWARPKVQRPAILTATALTIMLLIRFLCGELLHRIESNDTNGIIFYDLADSHSTINGWENGEKVLLCIPLRDAENHIPLVFSQLRNLSYPHSLLDIAFLISDSKDNTKNVLESQLKLLQTDADPYMRYRNAEVFEKDFGQAIGQDFSARHGFAAQGPRRKLMGRARNWLLSTALKPDHSWVYWRDADIESAPSTIIEDLMMHDQDVIVPNVWRPLPEWLGDDEQPYDLNAWQESDAARELAKTLNEDDVIVEGYAEYATWRPHLAYSRESNGNPGDEVDLDGVGGVSILVKAAVFRSGAHFPGFAFMNHAETEGFGKMCRKMDYTVKGLSNYVVWHIFEPSSDDLEKKKEYEQNKKKTEEQKEQQGVSTNDDKHEITEVSEDKVEDVGEAARFGDDNNVPDQKKENDGGEKLKQKPHFEPDIRRETKIEQEESKEPKASGIPDKV
ncbi:Anp1-domain-containing protein [Lipomyces japonicus]|uniref:Anp1-domain-containing protein n=1 Tax=Lipomyces japonicus TaxID=56871 RepID=UPI0034CD06A6